ncbi:MAG TPA: PH domain-containing protein [Candidatus Bipolaricaulota bacterium]|nr:PH domain-containing protein [Candidatus Bipolaricaulota bacterium]
MVSLTHFPNQQADETIILSMRRHWIAVFKLIVMFIALVGLILLFDLVAYEYTEIWSGEVGFSLMILGNSAYLLFVLLFSFSHFVDYYLDIWIVTDKRIINIEQKGLFARVVSEKELFRMQDVTSEVEGFWATFFNYGDVFIQTAGETSRFVFRQVPNASEVAQKISDLVTKTRETKPFPMYVTEPNAKIDDEL